jgi:syntaxin 1B/2/3
MTSTRHGEARSALREVQSRHQDIQKIERTITELAQLFNEMSIMIEVQETAIDNIEQKAQETETQMEGGLQHTEQAVVKARSARRKKWYCIGLILLIISMSFSYGLTCSCHCRDCHCRKTCDKVVSFTDRQIMVYLMCVGGVVGISWFL